jgi:hypothetical protein
MPTYTSKYGEIDEEFSDPTVECQKVTLSQIGKILEFDDTQWFIHSYKSYNPYFLIVFDNHFNIYKITQSLLGTGVYYYTDLYKGGNILDRRGNTKHKFIKKSSLFRLSNELIEVCKHITDETTFRIYVPMIYSKLI